MQNVEQIEKNLKESIRYIPNKEDRKQIEANMKFIKNEYGQNSELYTEILNLDFIKRDMKEIRDVKDERYQYISKVQEQIKSYEKETAKYLKDSKIFLENEIKTSSKPIIRTKPSIPRKNILSEESGYSSNPSTPNLNVSRNNNITYTNLKDVNKPTKTK